MYIDVKWIGDSAKTHCRNVFLVCKAMGLRVTGYGFTREKLLPRYHHLPQNISDVATLHAATYYN